MILSRSTDILWSTTLILQCIIVVAGIFIRLRLDYPAFFSYVAFDFGTSLVERLIVACNWGNTIYFWFYWTASVLEDVLLLAVLLEIARMLFASGRSSLWEAIVVPRWLIPVSLKQAFVRALGVLLIASCILPLCSRSTLGSLGGYWYLMAMARTMSRTVSMAMFGVMVLGVSFALYLEIPWRRRASLIATGLITQYGIQTWFWFASLSAARDRASQLLCVYLLAVIAACLFWIFACFGSDLPEIELNEEQISALNHYAEKLASRTSLLSERM